MKKVESPRKSAISMVFVTAFLEATTNVIITMAGLGVKPQAPKIKKSLKPLGDIAGVMPMTSPHVKGQLVISFTKESILGVSRQMLGEEFHELNDVVMDVAGEITNIATGGAKSRLELEGYDFDMARPYVVLKKDFEGLDLPSKKPQIVIPYNTDVGPIFIELGFEHVCYE